MAMAACKGQAGGLLQGRLQKKLNRDPDDLACRSEPALLCIDLCHLPASQTAVMVVAEADDRE